MSVMSLFSKNTYSRKYLLKRKIASTSLSNIYEATDRRTNGRLALKILKESGKKISDKLDRDQTTMWEGELLMHLNHPKIIRGFDYGTGKKYWISMELFDGASLDWSIYGYRDSAPLNQERLIDIFCDIAEVLTYLHSKKLVHLDLAADNVMIGEKGLKLIDLGLTMPVGSKVLQGRMGTPSYMAPEMIRKRNATTKVDIFAFGVLMYECLTGKKLFYGRSKEERMTRVLNYNPPAPSKEEWRVKDCEQLEELVMSCLEKNPEQRPESAELIFQRLKNIDLLHFC